MTEYHSILLQLYNTSTKKSIIDRRNTVNMLKNLNKYFIKKVPLTVNVADRAKSDYYFFTAFSSTVLRVPLSSLDILSISSSGSFFIPPSSQSRTMPTIAYL